MATHSRANCMVIGLRKPPRLGDTARAMSQENVEIVRGARYRVSLPPERAAARRTPDERLFVRFPLCTAF